MTRFVSAICAFFLFALGGCASLVKVADPPLAYREAPVAKELNIYEVFVDSVNPYCRAFDNLSTITVEACAFRLSKTTCLIFYKKSSKQDKQELRKLRIHERAHCKGWGHENDQHPNPEHLTNQERRLVPLPPLEEPTGWQEIFNLTLKTHGRKVMLGYK